MDVGRALGAVRATRQSVLVTLRKDGRPQLSNVVHLVGDDGLVRVSTTADRAKFHNLRRTPWAALKVDGESFWSYAVVEGDVTLSEVAGEVSDAAVEELVGLYRGISGEHPDWSDYRAAMTRDQRVIVALTPTRVGPTTSG